MKTTLGIEFEPFFPQISHRAKIGCAKYDLSTGVGVNIGGGADFALTSSWIMNFELRYQLVSDFDQAVFNLGFAYRF